MTLRVLAVLALVLLARPALARVPGLEVHTPQTTPVSIDSTPPGARVFDRAYQPGSDTGYLGTTPFVCEMPASVGHALWFELSGYATARAEVQPGQAGITVALQPSSPLAYLAHAFLYRPLLAWGATLALLGALAAGVQGVRRREGRLKERIRDAEERDPELSGRTIDGYEVLETLGAGSNGRVLRVRNTSFGEIFAMKILAERPDEAALARFHREVAVGRDVLHRNLTRVVAFGEHRGAPYLVMEFLSGETLRQRLDRGRLPIEEAVRIACQVAVGLAAAHSHRVIHRDLKPENLMILPDATVKIMDFGVAHVLDGRRLTATGTALGTPHYMSPEHLRATTLDGRSDLYSLGVILFEMLTGRVPFPGEDTYSVLAAHLSEEPPQPSELRPEVPEWLDDLVVGLLEKNPDGRPESAEEVLQDLLQGARE